MDLKNIRLEEDQTLSSLLRVTTESFAILNMQGGFLDLNPSFCTLLESSREELLHKTLFDLEPKETGTPLKEQWETICNGEVLDLRFTLRSSHGNDVDLTGNFFHHTSSEASLVCLFCKQAPKDPQSAHLEKLQTQALAAAGNAVVITDPEGNIIWANRSFSKYTGYSFDEALGKNPSDLLKSGHQPKEFYEEMWAVISRGEIWQGEIVNRRKDGSVYPEEMTITPIFNEEGVITHYIAIKQDVSEKKNLQNMFLRAQRLESVGTLASGVAHDLNNVLSPIVMSSDLLMVQVEDQKTLELLGMIKESAKRGAEIIRQLLTFARGDEDVMAELQLRHILKDIVKVYRGTFPKSITIEDRIPSAVHPIRGNATKLHQVFTNLMINARDAMPNGGELLLQVDNVTLGQEDAEGLAYARPGDFIRVRIQDSGMGIPVEMQKIIFQSFFTTKEQGKGTGLGLPTSLTILKNHQGFIEVESSEGVGSVFDVYLPVFKGASSQNIQDPSSMVSYGAGEQVLVIDDEESIGFMLKGTLKALDYDVKVVSSGEEGLTWWKENRESCDLILLDMMMPKMDGAGVCKELKKENCSCKILIMSGMVAEEKLYETEIDLENAYIAKPFTIADLSKKIRTLLDS